MKRALPLSRHSRLGALIGRGWLLLAGVLLCALVVVGVRWQVERTLRSEMADWLPATPDWSGAPKALPRAVRAAELTALDGPDRLAGLERLATLYHANGFRDEALQAYRAWEAWGDLTALPAYRRARLHAEFGQSAEALAALEIVRAEAPDYLHAALLEAELRVLANDVDRARALFERILQADPAMTDAWVGLGRLQLRTDDLAAARVSLERAAAQQPDYGFALNPLTGVYERLGDVRASAEIRRRLHGLREAARLPDPWMEAVTAAILDPYRLRVAAVSYRAVDPREVAVPIDLLKKALVLDPDEVGAIHRDMGIVYLRAGHLEGGRAVLERATEIDPETPDNWSFLVGAHRARGDEAAVERTLRDGLRRNPESHALWFEEGLFLARHGQWAAALERVEAFLEIRPEHTPAFLEQAALYLRLGNTEEAETALAAAYALEPLEPQVLSQLTALALNRGDAAAAVRWISEARASYRVAPERLERLEAAYAERFGPLP